MNNLILLSLGIEKIDDEVTTYDLVYDNVRVPFLVVIRNRYNQDEQDKFIKHNLAVD